MIDCADPCPPLGAAAQILERCAILAQITDEPGCITRGYLSPAMQEVNTLVAQWMEHAGLTTELDAAGNLIGTYPCQRDDAPVLVLGSHLDTVRDAGRYDGILGVLLALAVIEGLEGKSLPFELEIIGFADEEGLRFGAPFLGSQALIGALDPVLLDRCDAEGVRLGEAIRTWGGDPETLSCRYTGRKLVGYVEAHIEQGPWLEHEDLPLGILEAISGACWLDVRFSGQAGHAGTTPMALRRDPMPAAAEVVLAAEELARGVDGLVATVGKLSPTPGAGNVIPGSVELSLDIRHPQREPLASAVDTLLTTCAEVAERRELEVSHQVLHRQDGVQADAELSRLLGEAVGASGATAGQLVLGAGHDALVMARIMPMAMLLLRSPGGISHHPDEAVIPGDVEAALATLGDFIRRVANLESSRHRGTVWNPSWPQPATDPADATTWELDG